mmetsp:Transcript_9905/g.25452  ORF Transcript_9905/g.25452 Transcript_9905/m.25452 type:complete len:93 (+) Transcript_9905:1520-1798(+)
MEKRAKKLEQQALAMAEGGTKALGKGGKGDNGGGGVRLGFEVCTGKACKRKGAEEITKKLEQMGKGDPDLVVSTSGCMGACKKAPNVNTYPM